MDDPAGTAPARRRRLGSDPFRSAHVMGWIALSSLVAAIFLSVIIAIVRGDTAPLFITWMSALVLAAFSGLVAAFLVLSNRSRGSRSITLDGTTEGPGAL